MTSNELTSDTEDTVHFEKLSGDFSAILLSPKFSDITITVGDKILHAHKNILSSRSSYYARLFDNTTVTPEKNLKVEDTSLESFKLFLKYLYTGRISIRNLTMDAILEILGLSKFHGNSLLQQALLDQIVPQLSAQNVVTILNAAFTYKFSKLITICLNYIDKHTAELLKDESFVQCSKESLHSILKRDSFYAAEVDILKALIKWLQKNDEKSKAVLELIRLPLIEDEDILSIAWPSGLFDNEDILLALARRRGVKPDPTIHRGELVVDENVASLQRHAKVIVGLSGNSLLNDPVSSGFTWHKIDQTDPGIIVELSKPYIINHLQLLLYDPDLRLYSYYVEVSIDRKKWDKIIDYSEYHCRSLQNLYFPERTIQFIKLKGTRSSANDGFQVPSLKAFYRNHIPEMENSIIRPVNNVTTLDEKAVVLTGQGVPPTSIIDGKFTDYDGTKGYTWHPIGPNQSILIQLAQPYLISTLKLLLWDKDDRFYRFYIETSVNRTDWEIIADFRDKDCQSWQIMDFALRPVVYIKIVGTHNSINGNTGFHCVHLECRGWQKEPIRDEDISGNDDGAAFLKEIKLGIRQ